MTKPLEIDTGGQAFPCLERRRNGLELTDGGMTLRDYFAAHASDADVCAYMYEYDPVETQTPTEYKIVRLPVQIRNREQAKYAYADAMLEARK